MDECINSFCDATAFSFLDTSRGFWQTYIKDRDRQDPSFTSKHGPYHLVFMRFEVKYGTATIQRAIDVILASAKKQLVLVYFDSSVVFSKTVTGQIARFKAFLTSQNVWSNLEDVNCKFFSEVYKYLGHIISAGRLELSKYTIDAVVRLKHSTNYTQICLFFGSLPSLHDSFQASRDWRHLWSNKQAKISQSILDHSMINNFPLSKRWRGTSSAHLFQLFR